MKIFTPKYYQSFQCIASACPDSCCKEWAVDVDAQAAAFYRNLAGDLGNCLRQVLQDTDDGTVMTITNGRCPMWREDGLCRIQAELGHDALCQTCRHFPRLCHDYGNFMEYGLELSCPEAARLILTQSHEWVVENAPGSETPDYDSDLMEILLKSREAALTFLDHTTLSPNLALSVLLLYAHETQGWIDGGNTSFLDADCFIALAKKYATSSNWEAFLDFFRNLEILTPQWKARLRTPCEECSWHTGFLALAKYLIERYWLQAVSDYDLVGRVKFLISACLLVYRLGGNFLETAQIFSKEIENDPDNVDAILDGAYTSPALTDAQLLGLLLDC